MNNTVVCGTDFSELGGLAVDAAATIAKRFDAKLVLVHAMGKPPGNLLVPYSYTDKQLAEVKRRAHEFASKRLQAYGVGVPVDRIVREGAAGKELATIAAETNADMIVVSSHGYGPVKRLVLGSVAGGLIRTTDHPVLVVGPERPGTTPFDKVVAAVDLSKVSREVIEHATRMVAPGGELIILSLHEPPFVTYAEAAGAPALVSSEELEASARHHDKSVKDFAASLAPGDFSVRVEVHGHLSPPHAILDFLKEESADLCVLGTSGRTAWNRFVLGSTATRVLAEAPTPVLVVPVR